LANEEDCLASHARGVLEAEREGDLLSARLRAAESAQVELRDQLVEAHASLLERDVLAREIFERLTRCDEKLQHLKTREQQLLRYLKTREEQLFRDLRSRDEELRDLSLRLKTRQEDIQDLYQRLRDREWELRHIQGSRVWRVATMIWNVQKRLGRR
jgi:chromosome segregation ATPase